MAEVRRELPKSSRNRSSEEQSTPDAASVSGNRPMRCDVLDRRGKAVAHTSSLERSASRRKAPRLQVETSV